MMTDGKEERSNDTGTPPFQLPRMVEVQTRRDLQAWIPDIQDPAEYVGHPYTVVGPRTAACIMYYYKGDCEMGANCSFRHEKPADSIQASQESVKSGDVNRKQEVQDLAEKLYSNLVV